MVKHTQTNRWQFADELFEFDHFVKLAHKGLKIHFVLYVYKEIRSDIEICSKKLAIPLLANKKCMQETSITIIYSGSNSSMSNHDGK